MDEDKLFQKYDPQLSNAIAEIEALLSMAEEGSEDYKALVALLREHI
jgi:hypothetical protein